MFCFKVKNRHSGCHSLVLLLFFSLSLLGEDESIQAERFLTIAKDSKNFELVGLENFDGETIYKYFRNVSHLQNLSFPEKTPSSPIYEKETKELGQIYKNDGKSLLIDTYIGNPSRDKIRIEPHYSKFFGGGYPFRISLWVHSNYYKGNLSIIFKNQVFGTMKVDMGSLDFSGWKRLEQKFPFLEKKMRESSPKKEMFYLSAISIEFSKTQAPTHLILYLDRLGVLIEKFSEYPGREVEDSWGLK
jgi:hypothetical protein